ncbi:Mini zinc finger protein 1 [Capsicum annuum]|uniref:Mini zinc finger protein 1 n=1 Tax=Capsicum annuum TaxID=4072 RepID=A0A1U8G8V9_CAPAN|nr:uncharacterized protein LOC107865897 [Capsicum annuum]XP_016567576.1 uncharacterized protein LOC107865897 [Capsicum annuum]PHT88361.1 Mini zinc finger protein 1 [Capsicum annuum]
MWHLLTGEVKFVVCVVIKRILPNFWTKKSIETIIEKGHCLSCSHIPPPQFSKFLPFFLSFSFQFEHSKAATTTIYRQARVRFKFSRPKIKSCDQNKLTRSLFRGFLVNPRMMKRRQVVVRRNTSTTSSTRNIRYVECQRNHAANIGGYAVDGCREFMASGEEGTTAALTCAACGCHRNFHRREVDGGEVVSESS